MRPACDVNNRRPQLSYDWLLWNHPRKTSWEVHLKIKRYATGLTQRVRSYKYLSPFLYLSMLPPLLKRIHTDMSVVPRHIIEVQKVVQNECFVLE